MNLIIDLTPAEEAHLDAVAQRIGLAPSELVKQLVKEHLPSLPAQAQDSSDSNLRLHKEQKSQASIADVATQVLFAKWAEEDAQMTEEERTVNDRIYTEIEMNGITRLQI